MDAEEMALALLEAPDAASRRLLLVPRDQEFYIMVVSLLKDRADQERLRNTKAALQVAAIGAEVAAWSGFPRCRALAAWAQGNVLIHLGDYGECLQLYRQAAEFFAAEGAEVEAARLMSNQAFVLKNLGRYEEGLRAARAALAVLQRYPPSVFLASALNGLGVLYRLIGRDRDALQAFAEGEQIYGTLGDKVMQARMAINKANVLENLDRFGEALDLLHGARAVLARRERFLEVARADLNLGIIHTRLGRYDEALEALDRAQEGFTALENRVEAAVVTLYRADLYASFNLYDELLQTSVRDWQIFEERKMQWQAARAMLHKAVAWRQIGDAIQAEEMLQEAGAIFDRIGDPIWARTVELERLATWCEMGEWAQALPRAVESSAFFDDRGMPGRAAASSLLAAQCHLALGQWAEAIRRFWEVEERARELDVPWMLYRAHHGLGQVMERQGSWQAAYEHLSRALEMVERMRQGLRVEEFRLGFLEDKLQVYRDMVLLCLKMGREEEAFAHVERAKSGALVDLLIAGLGRQLSAQDETNRELVARLTALREQLNWYHSKLEGGSDGERGQDSHLAEAEVWERISAIEQQAVQAWRGFQQAAPFYTYPDSIRSLMPATVQVDLREDEILLEYYISGETILVFVVSHDGLRACLPLACTLSDLDDALAVLDTTLRNASRFDGGYVAGTLCPLSRQQLGWLYDDLLGPLEPFVAGARRLLVAPDGALFAVPFHALHDGRSYLLERYEIAYIPSAGTLRWCKENERRRRRAARALVVGYSGDDSLPYIQQEVEAVARAIPGAMVFTGDEASLVRLQACAAQSTLLHLATHAIFRRDNPLFSALQLAGGDWLRVMDLYTLRLNGPLVTLSGCETGRHRLLGGDLLGLSRGFFYAGASALVVSLWPVDDVSTAMLMGRFYSHLVAGETAASALRLAQLALCTMQAAGDGQQAQLYTHPFYWASFCLLGAPDVGLT
jgi:CHAT domain-containing protein